MTLVLSLGCSRVLGLGLLENVWREGLERVLGTRWGPFENLAWPHTVGSGRRKQRRSGKWRAWMERQRHKGAPGWTERLCAILGVLHACSLTQPSHGPGMWVLLLSPAPIL